MRVYVKNIRFHKKSRGLLSGQDSSNFVVQHEKIVIYKKNEAIFCFTLKKVPLAPLLQHDLTSSPSLTLNYLAMTSHYLQNNPRPRKSLSFNVHPAMKPSGTEINLSVKNSNEFPTHSSTSKTSVKHRVYEGWNFRTSENKSRVGGWK